MLNIQIMDAFINQNLQPVATIKIEDDMGNPFSIDEVFINWIISRIIETGQYSDYITREVDGAIQATSETDGEYEDMGGGVYTYTFETVLPEDFVRSHTHTVALYGSRDIGEQRWVSNATFDFVPSGGLFNQIRDIG